MRIPERTLATTVATDDLLLLEQKTTATSGTLVIGSWYLIDTLESGDDFTNVGYISPGVWFKAVATTPTTWTNSTSVVSYTSKSVEVDKILSHGGVTTTWYKRSYTFADFSAAATFKEDVMAVAPANSILRRYRIVHTAAFTGGSISACTLAIKMGSLFTSSYNIFQAPAVTKGADITLSYSTTISDSSGFNISYYIQATGGNLDTLTTGAVDIWFEVITYN
jgi:hypothetical protein